MQEAVGVNKGYDYARVANPTRTALQLCLASLENAEFGAAYASGIAATTTLMHLVHPSEKVVCVNDVYGGVYRLFTQVYEPKGYSFEFLDVDTINSSLADHIDEQTRIVWLETPTNPLLNIVDIAAAAKARTRSARWSSSTTRSRPRTSNARSTSAPMSSSTR